MACGQKWSIVGGDTEQYPKVVASSFLRIIGINKVWSSSRLIGIILVGIMAHIGKPYLGLGRETPVDREVMAWLEPS